MKLPIQSSPGDQGSFLQLDPDRETIALLGPNDEILGLLTWAAMNQFIRKTGTSGFDATRRNYPRASLALKVRYKTPDGKQLASVSRDIGGGGLFIESNAAPASRHATRGRIAAMWNIGNGAQKRSSRDRK